MHTFHSALATSSRGLYTGAAASYQSQGTLLCMLFDEFLVRRRHIRVEMGLGSLYMINNGALDVSSSIVFLVGNGRNRAITPFNGHLLA